MSRLQDSVQMGAEIVSRLHADMGGVGQRLRPLAAARGGQGNDYEDEDDGEQPLWDAARWQAQRPAQLPAVPQGEEGCLGEEVEDRRHLLIPTAQVEDLTITTAPPPAAPPAVARDPAAAVRANSPPTLTLGSGASVAQVLSPRALSSQTLPPRVVVSPVAFASGSTAFSPRVVNAVAVQPMRVGSMAPTQSAPTVLPSRQLVAMSGGLPQPMPASAALGPVILSGQLGSGVLGAAPVLLRTPATASRGQAMAPSPSAPALGQRVIASGLAGGFHMRSVERLGLGLAMPPPVMMQVVRSSPATMA